MKHAYSFLSLLILISNFATAANKYWVGPIYGSWATSANWSLTSGGAGGAGAPGLSDDVQFTGVAKVIMNANPVIKSLSTSFGSGKVVLVATTNVTITILNNLVVAPLSFLKDSTAANVFFDMYFKTGATASILGDWIFEGGVPVTGTGGASFTAGSGSLVSVTTMPGLSPPSGRIVCNINSKRISSTAATLKFDNSTYFVSNNVRDAVVPSASWAKDSSISSSGSTYIDPASSILLSGSLSTVTFTGAVHEYGNLVVDLPLLINDVNLAIPDGTKFSGSVTVNNTNNFIVTLLAATGPASSVKVEVGTTAHSWFYGGSLSINGASTKVSMAKATALAPATSYKLLVEKQFVQTAGNFSLQDYNFATGSSTLDIKGNFNETGGTFFTNSTSTSPLAKFRVVMDDPTFYTGPSSDFQSSRFIKASSGTIDNGLKMVTLVINHTTYGLEGGSLSNVNGVILQSPLTVGRLDLVKSPLTTSLITAITVSNPSPDAITVGSSTSYVNGPLKRATNSTAAYLFPTGEGNTAAYGYHFDSCLVTPSTNVPSLYYAQFYNSGYGIYTTVAPLEGVSTNKRFYVTRFSGADAKVTLCLNGAVIGSTASKGIVVAYVGPGGKWIKVNGTIKTPGTSATGSVTSKVLSDFGYFTFGYGVPASLILLPITSVTLSENPVNILKITGEKSPTPSIYPNPFIDNFIADFYNPGSANSNAMINIFDLKGSLVYSQKINNLATGSNKVRINMTGKTMPAAVYTVQLTINGVLSKTVKLVKQ